MGERDGLKIAVVVSIVWLSIMAAVVAAWSVQVGSWLYALAGAAIWLASFITCPIWSDLRRARGANHG